MPSNQDGDHPKPEPKANRGGAPPSPPKKTATALGDDDDGGKRRNARELLEKALLDRLRGEERE